MSVIIKGMKIPKCCLDCPMNFNLFYCEAVTPWKIITDKTSVEVNGKEITITRPDWCPLVELPEKHGRLIDADALADDLEYDAQNFDDDHELKFNAAMWLRSNQNKVIVEAESEE